MSYKESEIEAQVVLEAPKHACVLWKNARGYDKEAKQRYGVGTNGASDLIGLKVVTITPDMVGREIAVFTAVEIKTPNGRVKPEQEMFIRAVLNKGGFAGVARSAEDLKNIFNIS